MTEIYEDIQTVCPVPEFPLLSLSGDQIRINRLKPGDGIEITGDECLVISATGSTVSLIGENCSPNGANLVVDGTGPDLAIRGIQGGSGIGVTQTDECVVIDSTVTLSSEQCSPGAISLVLNGEPPNFEIACLEFGGGISIEGGGNGGGGGPIIISLNISIESAVCSPNGASLVLDGDGPEFKLKGIQGGTGVTIDDEGECVVINAMEGTDVTLTDMVCSPEPGSSLILDGQGPDLKIRRLAEGPGILIDSDESCLTISGVTIEETECSPSAGSVSLLANPSGPDYVFKKLQEGSGVTLTDVDGCIQVSSNIILTDNECSPAESSEESPEESPALLELLQDASLIVDGVGPNLQIKRLQAGPGIVFEDLGSCLNIATATSGTRGQLYNFIFGETDKPGIQVQWTSIAVLRRFIYRGSDFDNFENCCVAISTAKSPSPMSTQFNTIDIYDPIAVQAVFSINNISTGALTNIQVFQLTKINELPTDKQILEIRAYKTGGVCNLFSLALW